MFVLIFLFFTDLNTAVFCIIIFIIFRIFVHVCVFSDHEIFPKCNNYKCSGGIVSSVFLKVLINLISGVKNRTKIFPHGRLSVCFYIYVKSKRKVFIAPALTSRHEADPVIFSNTTTYKVFST